jgi:transposase
MKDDAFDDVRCPFNYKAELKRARRALNAKVAKYIAENPMVSYRELAKKFHLSLGTLCKIARRYEPKRKPGPRPRRPRSIDDATVPLLSDAKHPRDLP